jgi:protein ImuB
VAIDDPNSIGNGQSAIGNSLFLDLTGCQRVFHGIQNLLRQIKSSLLRLKITNRLAVAPTPGAAWALAYAGKDGAIVDSSQLLSSLFPLPLRSLRIGQEIAGTLHHLGIETIGQLMELPRETLPSRFGKSLLDRLDQALGRLNEPLTPLVPFVAVQARMDFDGSVESLETLWIVFKELIGRIVADLTNRGCGARQIEIDFPRQNAGPVRKTLQLSRPTRDPVNLFNLIRCATEKLETDDGFLGVHLKVPLFERLDHEQIALLEHEQYAGQRELEGLIERLRIRMGTAAVVQPTLVESHVPELAYAFDRAGPCRPGPERHAPALLESISSNRPLHLLTEPVEVHAMVSPSHDRDGHPILFNHKGTVHDLKYAVGPERIAGRWWDGRPKTRDYFDVENGDGKRFWIFRVMETGRWYLHGFFE